PVATTMSVTSAFSASTRKVRSSIRFPSAAARAATPPCGRSSAHPSPRTPCPTLSKRSLASTWSNVTKMNSFSTPSAVSASIPSRNASMQRIIKGDQVVDETWHLLPKDVALADIPNCDDVIVPMQLWLEHSHALKARDGGLGVWLDADEAVEDIADNLEYF